MGRGVVVCLGDSLTQHGQWVGGLMQWYQRKADVLNRGYSGYNSSQGLFLLRKQIQEDVWPRGAQLVLVWFGANDAAIPPQKVDVSDFVSNLESICSILGSLGSRVVLITPPAYDEEQWDQHCRDTGKEVGSRNNLRSGVYADAVIRIGARLSIPVVELWSSLQSEHSEGSWKKLLSDGLHFNASGDVWVLGKIRACIEAQFPDLAPKSLWMDAPLWSELHCDELEKSWDSSTRKADFY